MTEQPFADEMPKTGIPSSDTTFMTRPFERVIRRVRRTAVLGRAVLPYVAGFLCASTLVTRLASQSVPADLHLIAPDGSSLYQATNSITADTSFIVSGTVLFHAGNRIVLGPGFNANTRGAATWFHALIVNFAPPSLGALSANPTTGGGPTAFSFPISDGNGSGAVGNIQIIFNWTVGGAGACFLNFFPQVNAIYLAKDSGADWYDPVAPGENKTVSNSQCSLDAQHTGVQVQGNTLTFTPRLSFTPAFLGPQNVLVHAMDGATGEDSGWQTLGAYTAYPPVTNSLPQVLTSISGTEFSGTFTFRAADGNGYAYIPIEYIAIMPPGTTGWGAGGCNFVYLRADNSVYLIGDNGLDWLLPALHPGTPGTAGNSQCRIDASAAPVIVGANELDLPVTITFNAGFTGLKNVWQSVTDHANQSTGWQQVGTWTVGTPAPSFSLSSTNLGAASIQAGATATYQITLSAVNGFNSSVSFAVPAPNGMTITFNPTTVTGSGSTIMTVSTTPMTLTGETVSGTEEGAYNLSITASGGGVNQMISVPLGVLLTVNPTAITLPLGAYNIAFLANGHVPVGSWSLSPYGLYSGWLNTYASDNSTYTKVWYSAPGLMPSGPTITLTAQDQSHNTGTATITLKSSGSQISITPGTATVPAIGGSGTIVVQSPGSWNATINTNDTGVHWSGTQSKTINGSGNASLPYYVDQSNSYWQDPKSINVGGAFFGITQNGSSGGSDPLTITTTSPLPPGTVGQSYSARLVARGGTPPYSWSVAQGSTLPNWLSLSADGNDGVLSSSTQPVQGSYTFTLQVTDSASPAHAQATQSLTLTIQAVGTLVISNVQTPSQYLTTTASTVTWITSANANSQIYWGTSASYTFNTTLDGTLTQTHQQYIVGLAPGTTYHYQVRSTDQSGNLATSQDLTFTTPTTPPPVPSDFYPNCIQGSSPTCTLNPGTYLVSTPIIIGRSDVTVQGATDPSQTLLVRDPGKTQPMMAVDATLALKGIAIKNLAFCGGSLLPNRPSKTVCPTPTVRTECGRQVDELTCKPDQDGVCARNCTGVCKAPEDNPGICTDLYILNADTGLYPTDPVNYAGPYSVSVLNCVFEDATGHAIALYPSAPKKVNDVYISGCDINHSAVTGILSGVTYPAGSPNYGDPHYCDNTPLINDPTISNPRNIRIENSTFANNSTGAMGLNLARWVGLRNNTKDFKPASADGKRDEGGFKNNYINPQAGNQEGGSIFFEQCADKVQIYNNEFQGPGNGDFSTSGLELWGRNIDVQHNNIWNYYSEGIGLNSVYWPTIKFNTVTGNGIGYPRGDILVWEVGPGACDSVYRDTQMDPATLNIANNTTSQGVFRLDRGGIQADTINNISVQSSGPVFVNPWVNLTGAVSGATTTTSIADPQPPPRALPVDVIKPLTATSPAPVKCSSPGTHHEVFSFAASDIQGSDHIAEFEAVFSSVAGVDDDTGVGGPGEPDNTGAQGCYFLYIPSNNLLLLDGGSGGLTNLKWSTVGADAGGTDITNGYCTIHAGSTDSHVETGPKVVKLTLDIDFPNSATVALKKHMYAATENVDGVLSDGGAWRYWGWWLTPLIP